MKKSVSNSFFSFLFSPLSVSYSISVCVSLQIIKSSNKRTLFKVRMGGRKRNLAFTSDLDDICSFTLVPVRDLK